MNDDEFDQMLRDRHESFVTELAVHAPPLPQRTARVSRLRLVLAAVRARPSLGALRWLMTDMTRSVVAVGVVVSAGAAAVGVASAVHSGQMLPPPANTGRPDATAAVAPPRSVAPRSVAPPSAALVRTIEFLPNSITLAPGSHEILHAFAWQFRVHPSGEITLVGRTASVGPADSAVRLSVNRAVVVRDKLVEYGVSAGSIHVRGVGHNDPLAPDRDQSGNLIPNAAQRNRSVTIMVTT